MWWFVRKWWTESDPSLLLHSENRLLSSLVNHPFRKPDEIISDDKHAGLNLVEFRARHAEATAPNSSLPTIVMAHGFGSGLSFFYRNIDHLLNSGKVKRVILVDWLGMGGSTRLPSGQSPIRSIFSNLFTSSPDVFPHLNFFLDPFDSLLRDKNLFVPGEPIWLVGHSLGGYLAAKYVMRIHEEEKSTSNSMPQQPNITKLVLASPVGFQPLPSPHELVPLPFALRLFKALWIANWTPQAIVRLMGSSRGKRSVKHVLHRRIPHLNVNSVTDDGQSELDLLSEYLYHITVAPASGEYAMNSLLEPSANKNGIGIFALESLGSGSMADAISTKHRSSSLESIKVLYGDHDCMKFHEPMARQEMQEILSKCSIRSSVQIVPNAGHHLYLDNPDIFNRQILED